MTTKTTKYTPRLRKIYDESLNDLKKELGITNVHDLPKLEKIVINTGLGRNKDEKRAFEAAKTTILKITGQAPVTTVAKKSIAAFKLREGNPIGMKVTLRGQRMYEFLDRLVNIVLPRLRDFHGVSNKAFDKNGNYSIGLKEQSAFAELSFEDTTFQHGLQIILVLKSDRVEHSKALLEKLGMPFEKIHKPTEETK